MKITNEGSSNFIFSEQQFFIIQANYKGLQEVVFTDHVSLGFLQYMSEYVVAIFKVKPKASQPAETNMDIAEDIIYESRKNKAA